MMHGRWSNGGVVVEVEELEFRYRSLLAAQRILDEKVEPSSGSGALRTKRLKSLRRYIEHSISVVERQMAQLGLPRPETPLADMSSRGGA